MMVKRSQNEGVFEGGRLVILSQIPSTSKAHARLPDGACRRVSAACAADIADDGVAKYHLGSTSTCSGKKWFMSCEVTSPPVPH